MSEATIHIAGPPISIGPQLRQRCSWCGAVLIDQDLSRIAVQIDPDNPDDPAVYPTWPGGELIAVEGDARTVRVGYIVEHVDGEPLPEGACGKLDPAVTA